MYFNKHNRSIRVFRFSRSCVISLFLFISLILVLLPSSLISSQQYHFKFGYRHDNFERGERKYGPWHLLSFDLAGKYEFGTIIGRINYANRSFGSRVIAGAQYELDVYPKITKGLYAYLNAGYSSSPVFPKYRFGGELYKSLPYSFEISAGFRHLRFSRKNVPIYTGSLGKYHGNYWISLKPFVTSKVSGLSLSGMLSIRKYLGIAEEYYGFMIGYGSSPSDLIFLEDIERLNSYKVGLEVQRLVARNLIVKIILRFEREEFFLDNYGSRLTLNMSFRQLLFKKE